MTIRVAVPLRDGEKLPEYAGEIKEAGIRAAVIEFAATPRIGDYLHLPGRMATVLAVGHAPREAGFWDVWVTIA